MKKKLSLLMFALVVLAAFAVKYTHRAPEPIVIASWENGVTADPDGTWSIANPGVTKESNNSAIGYNTKYNAGATEVSTISFASSIASSGAWTSYLKLAGDFKAGDIITIQPFTTLKQADWEAKKEGDDTQWNKWATVVLYDKEIQLIADLTGSNATTRTVTNGTTEEGAPNEFTYTLENDYDELYFGRSGNTRISVMKITVTREAGEGGGDVPAAEPVEFTFNTDAGIAELGIAKPGTGEGANLKDLTPANQLNKGTVTITTTDGSTPTRVWNSSGTLELRIYKNATLTFVATDNNITKIELDGAAVNVFSVTDGTFNAGTWTGDAASVTLTATGTGKINTITVTYGEAPAVTVATPTFSPAAGEYTEDQTVTIACETEGATIYYALGEGDFQAYTGPLSITETTTIKAYAQKGENQSATATATYTINKQVAPATIAELNALGNGATFTFTGEALVVAKPTAKYVYVKDATASSLIYDASGEKTAAAEVGKTIKANWTGSVSIYNGLFEAIPDAALVVTDAAAAEVTYDEIVLADVTAANVNKIVKLADVTIASVSGKNFNIKKGDATIVGYNQFAVEGLANGLVCSEMIGAISVYNETVQFQPISFTVGTPAPDPADIVISPESGDISAALAEATALQTAKNITINLTENGTYTISAPINATASVAINGAAGAKIDASALTGNGFINFATVTGAKAMKDETTESAYTILENITIKDVEITALPKSIINSAAGKVLFKNILVSNAVIKMTGNVNVFGLGGGYPENLKIENSTIWSDGVHQNFFFKADGKPADVTATSTTTWTVDHSTLYNIAIGKKANNSNGGIKGKKTTTMILTNSILYNFGSSSGSEVNGWLWGQNGGAQSVYANNTYWSAEGAVAGWTDATKGGSDQSATALATDPTFADAANGNFTIGATTAQALMKTGDPRWLVDYVAPETAETKDIVIDAEKLTAAGNDISKAFAVEKYAIINALNNFSGKVSVTLAADGAYTISSPIEATSDVAINGAAGAKIDASALTGNGFINFATVTGAKAMKDETTESAYTILENITIKDVEITALPKSIINSAAGKVLFKNILVSNAVIKMTGNVNVFGLGGGYPENLKIENSTIWSDGVHQNFFFKADGKPADVTATSTTTWTVDHSTLYNIAIGKKANNSNGGIKGKKTTTMILTNSILYNFGSSSGSEVNGWLWGQNGGAQSVYANNTYWSAEGAVAGWTDATKGGSDQSATSLTTDPGFDAEKIAAGDFTIGASTAQAKFKTGDPRWLVEFTGGYTITMGTITNGTVAAGGTSPYAAGEKVYLTLTPEEGYAIDNMPTFKNDESVDVTEQVTVGKDDNGFYLVMPAFNITASYAFSKLYNITLPTETTYGTVTIVKPEGTTKSVAGKSIKIKVTDLASGYKVVAKSGDTEITLNDGDHNEYDYYFEMPEGDVTISIELATGINSIAADKMKDATIYTISGQRVEKAQKGLYIINGKKVVIK